MLCGVFRIAQSEWLDILLIKKQHEEKLHAVLSYLLHQPRGFSADLYREIRAPIPRVDLAH